MLITDEHGLFGLGDAAIYQSPPLISTGTSAPVVPSTPPDKPLIVATPFGLYPRWVGSDVRKTPDWYQWQLLPGMTSTAAAPSGSYASVDAGRQAMQDWNTQRQAARAAAAAQQQVLAQQIAAMTATTGQEVFQPGGKFYQPSRYEGSLAQQDAIRRRQAGTPVNWGPLDPNTPQGVPEHLTVTGKSPLLWWIAGAALVAGAGFLLLRRKK